MKMKFKVCEPFTQYEFDVDVPDSEYINWKNRKVITYNEKEYNASMQCIHADGTVEMLLTPMWDITKAMC